MNVPGILFRFLRDTVKKTRNGSRKIKSWIPHSRLISDILMESKLIASLEDDEKYLGLVSTVGSFFNSKILRNMGLIMN